MTIRKKLADTEAVHCRLEQVLNEEDRVVILADRHHVSCYVQGFAASPCQLESIEHEPGAFLARRLRPRLRDGSARVGAARG